MKREIISPRANARARTLELGLLHTGTAEKPYWDERACYHFSESQILEIEQATAELHVMCMKAVQHVIDHNLFDRLKIPAVMVPYIKQSWAQRDPFVYGRFDLAYDGSHPPKMLEYNADTPTSLIEASVIQYDWMVQKKAACQLPADADQFNFIHESLTRAWQRVKQEVTSAHGSFPETLHFTAMMENDEDAQTVNYMADVADEAGINARVVDLGKIGSDGARFYDDREKPIAAMFKLYPWEWIVKDAYGAQVLNNKTGLIEPAWKMILSNKGIMAVLWELFPGHPNLLPTFDRPGQIAGAYVTKPFISREGANVTIHHPRDAAQSGGDYGAEGVIYQAYAELPEFDGNHPIIGSWITGSKPTYPDMPMHERGGEACGFGIREDSSRITNNESRFVPHYFTAHL